MESAQGPIRRLLLAFHEETFDWPAVSAQGENRTHCVRNVF